MILDDLRIVHEFRAVVADDGEYRGPRNKLMLTIKPDYNEMTMDRLETAWDTWMTPVAQRRAWRREIRRKFLSVVKGFG